MSEVCSSCGDVHEKVFVTDDDGLVTVGLVIGETNDGLLVIETSSQTLHRARPQVRPYHNNVIDDFPDDEYDGGLGSGKWLEDREL